MQRRLLLSQLGKMKDHPHWEINAENLLKWQAKLHSICGKSGEYSEGEYLMTFDLSGYPASAPIVQFITPNGVFDNFQCANGTTVAELMDNILCGFLESKNPLELRKKFAQESKRVNNEFLQKLRNLL